MIEQPERRARTVAWVGLLYAVVQAAGYGVLFFASGSEAMRALLHLAIPAIPIWLILLIVYHHRIRVKEETFESEQLRHEREGATGGETIFDVDDEQLLLARRRLRWICRWLLPIFTLLIILDLSWRALWAPWGFSLFGAEDDRAWPVFAHGDVLPWFVGAAAFATFLLSRYVTGMARYPEWRMLRAGATYLMGITLASVAVAAVIGTMQFVETHVPEQVLAYVLRILMLALAAEFALNWLMDFYRPRGLEEEPRPAFESRLLGLFTEPGGIARSIAEAVNYQFGFEVSSTWFYKLLARAFVPLIGFAVLTLFLATIFTFIESDEEAVLYRYGRVERVLDPGLHVKLPWPFDSVRKVETRRLHEMRIGEVTQTAVGHREEELILWTNEHGDEPHMDVLVATPRLVEFLDDLERDDPDPVREVLEPRAEFRDTGEAVPVSLLRVAVTLKYEIRDTLDWVRRYAHPEKVIDAIAQREVTALCASVDVDSLMGVRRSEIEEELRTRMQASLDAMDVGVDLVFLALQGVHPPVAVSEAFQEVMGAEQKRTASERSARADYNRQLGEAAGSVRRAETLVEAIRRFNELEARGGASAEARAAARKRVDELLFGDMEARVSPAGGKAGERILAARAERWRLENQAHGRAVQFVEERRTMEAAPRAYRMRKYLEAMTESMDRIRKFVVGTGMETPIFHLNLQDPSTVPLDIDFEPQD